ncbi:MAG: hypothetical protein R3321_12525, partial [Nitrososphaeraceae archaeon]|nr:hypothetical protein [Nitrososphaeraceae archaeon]
MKKFFEFSFVYLFSLVSIIMILGMSSIPDDSLSYEQSISSEYYEYDIDESDNNDSQYYEDFEVETSKINKNDFNI